MEKCLKVKNATAGYDNKTVIKDLCLEFDLNSFVSIIGPNGSGKTTLLHALIGAIPVSEGEIEIFGNVLGKWKRKDLAKKISIIPQEFIPQFSYVVEDLIMMGNYPHSSIFDFHNEDMESNLNDVLDRLELKEKRKDFYSSLSGGEKQRVSIARSLIQKTPVLLMDESFSNLDINHQIELMNLLKKLKKERNMLIILVSHNINLAATYCDRIVMLKQGIVIADGNPENVINRDNLRKLYDHDINIIKTELSNVPLVLYK